MNLGSPISTVENRVLGIIVKRLEPRGVYCLAQLAVILSMTKSDKVPIEELRLGWS